MDELTAVRELLAERPPPAASTMAAARARLERAGLERGPTAVPGRVPLRLNGGAAMTELGRSPRRQRLRGWLAPVAAAMAVIVAVGASLAIAHTVAGPQGREQADNAAAAFAQVPRYFVALTGGNTLPDQGQRAVVAATATGSVLGSVTAPRPYRVFTWIAAAGDDRTFVLAAQRARPVPGDTAKLMGAGAAKLYRLVLRQSGRPGALEPLRLPLVSGGINGFALSPDGTKLAVSSRPAAVPGASGSRLQVFSLATGARRSWTMSGVGWIGQDKPSAQSLVWAANDRTLLFKQYQGEGGATAQIRLLDTTAPGGSLATASSRVPFPSDLISGRVEDPVRDYRNMLLTPDGHKIISVVSTLTWRGRTGLAPSGDFAGIVHRILPPRCRGTGRDVVRHIPDCTSRLMHREDGKKPALRQNAARQQAESGTSLAFTEFSAATAKPVTVLGRLRGEGRGIVWADVTWASPAGTAMIIDGAWPTAGGSWPTSGGTPVPVAGVLTGGTFTPFPEEVQSLFFGGQATW